MITLNAAVVVLARTMAQGRWYGPARTMGRNGIRYEQDFQKRAPKTLYEKRDVTPPRTGRNQVRPTDEVFAWGRSFSTAPAVAPSWGEAYGREPLLIVVTKEGRAAEFVLALVGRERVVLLKIPSRTCLGAGRILGSINPAEAHQAIEQLLGIAIGHTFFVDEGQVSYWLQQALAGPGIGNGGAQAILFKASEQAYPKWIRDTISGFVNSEVDEMSAPEVVVKTAVGRYVVCDGEESYSLDKEATLDLLR